MNELRSFLQWRVKSSRQPGSLRTLSQFSLNKARIHKKVCSETRGQSTGSVSSVRKTLWPVLDHASLLNAVWSSCTYMSTHSHCGGFNTATGHKQELGHDYKAGLIWSKSSKSNWRGREWTNAPVQTEQKLSIQRSYSYTNTCYNVVFLWS